MCGEYQWESLRSHQLCTEQKQNNLISFRPFTGIPVWILCCIVWGVLNLQLVFIDKLLRTSLLIPVKRNSFSHLPLQSLSLSLSLSPLSLSFFLSLPNTHSHLNTEIVFAGIPPLFIPIYLFICMFIFLPTFKTAHSNSEMILLKLERDSMKAQWINCLSAGYGRMWVMQFL